LNAKRPEGCAELPEGDALGDAALAVGEGKAYDGFDCAGAVAARARPNPKKMPSLFIADSPKRPTLSGSSSL